MWEGTGKQKRENEKDRGLRQRQGYCMHVFKQIRNRSCKQGCKALAVETETLIVMKHENLISS